MNKLLFIVIFFFGCVSSYAQNAGNVRGMVFDEADRPLDGVMVELAVQAITDTTDISGRFSFDNVPVGDTMLSAGKPGYPFQPHTQRITVTEDSTVTIMIRLIQRTYMADEVVIIASPLSHEERVESEPSQVDVVTRAEFEVNAVTVEDVIKSTPSASISSYGGLGAFSEVSLRGSYTNQVQVYIDGMLLNESLGGSVNLSLIPLTNVDRVEIWRSGAPARFGGDAVGGAINIVTREYRENDGSLSLSYGSFGTVTGSGIMGFGPADSRLTVTVDAAASQNDFEYTSDNGTPQNPDDDYTAARRNNEFRTLNGLVKYHRLMGTDLSLELSEHILYSLKNLPSTQHILDSSASLKTAKNLLQASLVWAPASSPWFEAAPTIHSIISREHYKDLDDQVGWGNQDNIYETVSYQGMIPVMFRYGSFGEVTVTPVAGHESYDPEHNLEKTVPLSSDREHIGVVGDIILHIPNRMVAMTANIRRDRYFSDYEGQPNPYTPEPPVAVFHYLTNMQAGIAVEPHKLISLRFNYGDNWRVTSFYELFGDRGSVVSKPGLQPEHVYRWDAGVRIILPQWTGHLDGRFDIVRFDNDYRNLIQWYTNSYGFIEPANVARSYIRGTELVWNMSIFGHISLRGSWTYQKSKVTDTAKSYHRGKKLPNRPEQYGNAAFEYVQGRASYFWTIDHKEVYYLDRANQEHMKYPGRTVQDVGLSLGFYEDRIRWRFTVENLTDVRTFDIHGMPKPGRSYTTTISCTL